MKEIILNSNKRDGI